MHLALTYPQSWYPQVMITFVHYPTEEGASAEGARFIDNVSLEGPIPVIVRDTLAVLRRNMSRRSVVAGAGRLDTWDYPETALREAVVNALVHRDLSPPSRGTQVQIEMYPDRLVVRNPGGLFGPARLSELGTEGVSSSRNSVLLRILEDVPIPGEDRTVCENRGSGIRTMIQALRNAGMSVPEFVDTVSTFRVTFPRHALLSDEMVAWIGSLSERDLTDSQVVGLALMREGRVVDNATYRSATGIDSRVATLELQDLVARELVQQTGGRRWAKYRLHERLYESGETAPESRRRTPADRRRELLDALGDSVCSRAELADATGLSDGVVRRWLQVLRREGRVELIGGSGPQSKNTKYRRLYGEEGDQAKLFS